MRCSVLAGIVLALAFGCAESGTSGPSGQSPFGVTGQAGSPPALNNSGTAGAGSQAGSAAAPPTNPPPNANSTGMNNPPPANGTAGAAAPMNPMNPATGGSAGAGSMAGTAGMPGMQQMPTPMGGKGDPVIPPPGSECPNFTSGTISYGGVSGITMVAGPKASSPSAPMVLYWHGTGSFAGEYAGMAAAVSQGVQAEGGVLISFQSSSGQGDSSCSGTFIFSLGDMDIIDDLVGCAVKNHNVDPRRIYTTGCSAGGLFSACLAARRSSYIAAAAPNSGGFAIPQPFETMYTPALMTVHGAAGRDVVIIDFSNSSATADMAFKSRGGFVINCDHGGGHCGGAGQAPSIWKFFKAHPYGVDPYPWAGGLPADFDPKCKIF